METTVPPGAMPLGEMTTDAELRLLRRLAAHVETIIWPDSPESCLRGRDRAVEILKLLGLDRLDED